jgi:hypothetical protein
MSTTLIIKARKPLMLQRGQDQVAGLSADL